MDARDLKLLEIEARRLRRQYAHDLVVRFAITLDLAIRRVAAWMLSTTDDRGARCR